MKIYLVGGAVRDELLGLPVKERDWVVVGATPEEMLRLGYRQVGRDFPVFLHPDTQEEYALARTERKVGPGHTGFVCHAGPEVTLEDDLKRRDLTLNAIARDLNSRLIDPWGGQRDIDARVLRHVSNAFVEDPLRVFRVARFAASLSPLGFKIAAETLELMQRMATGGALRELAAERVFRELEKALSAPAPMEYFGVLTQAHSLADWFPELMTDRGAEALRSLERTAAALTEPVERFGVLGWDLSPADVLSLVARLKVPRQWADLISALARRGHDLAGYEAAPPVELLAVLKELGALRHTSGFERTARVAAAVSEHDLSPVVSLVAKLREVPVEPLRARGLEGQALGEALDRERVELIRRERD